MEVIEKIEKIVGKGLDKEKFLIDGENNVFSDSIIADIIGDSYNEYMNCFDDSVSYAERVTFLDYDWHDAYRRINNIPLMVDSLGNIYAGFYCSYISLGNFLQEEENFSHRFAVLSEAIIKARAVKEVATVQASNESYFSNYAQSMLRNLCPAPDKKVYTK